jgi:hypothetical protein
MTGRKGFDVAPWMDRLGGFIERHPARWIKLGGLETHLVESALANVRVERPIYVTGLARSGTTILLEILARHPEVATHRYRDFPMVFTPYGWNRWLELVPRKEEVPAERSHGDGIAVTSESPEAFEEPLWMAFFPELHDATQSAVLDGVTHHPLFERFYRDHIRKLLAVRDRRRYVAKGNYNVTRIGYLAKLFPDARFVIPVRDPVWHIASLMKQHRLFLDGQRDNPAARRHLRRVGHFEFGEDRRPIRIGDGATTAEIVALWQAGEEVRGWARYWAQIHHHIADLMERERGLRSAIRMVRYEDLCASPHATLRAVLDHCALPATEPFLSDAAGGLHQPTYYRPRFSAEDLAIIAEETAEAAGRLGYRVDSSTALRQSAE